MLVIFQLFSDFYMENYEHGTVANLTYFHDKDFKVKHKSVKSQEQRLFGKLLLFDWKT